MNRTDVEKLHLLMRKVTHKSRHLQMRHLQCSGDLRLLRMISCREVGVLPSQLAKKTEVSLPTISQKLSVLEKQGFIERKNCEEDRRKILIYATKKGEELVNEEYREFMDNFLSVCGKMGEEKVLLLTKLLGEMNEYLDMAISGEGEKNETC